MVIVAALFVIFAEPGFPAIDVGELTEIPGAVECRSVGELRDALQPGRVLVWRHGSAFPAEAWGPVREFLEQGGSLLYLGGEPFTRVVTGDPGARRVGPRSVSLLKDLRLNQCYRVDVGEATLVGVGPAAEQITTRTLPKRCSAAVLEPRLSDAKDFPAEDGSPGTRDGYVTPLAHIFRMGESQRFPVAAGALAIDHVRGRFAGGRWVLWSLDAAPTAAERDALLAAAAEAPVEFRVDPLFGCFHALEQPGVTLRLHRPRAAEPQTFEVALRISTPGGELLKQEGIRLVAGQHGALSVPLELSPRPGLYRVSASAAGLPDVETGFWVFDRELFESGDALSFDAYTLRRNGQPEPVIGTTVMSATVHRNFLFEPNAAVWDDTFGELAALHVNLVRTGVWSGWRKIAAQPGVIDEAWLRALEAYYLSARKHGIPVVFTFFAFLPESWGGANPYLDPRSVEAQRAYVSAVAQRLAGAREMLWDLINEPSFSSAEQLWKCRPNGDAFEAAAFTRWLERRYDGAPGGEAWEEIVRRRWRLRPDEAIGLPTLEDFDDRTVFESRRPYRAAEYMHFASDAFADWARQMRAAIRAAGSQAAITVGQDEGGLMTRPNPLFHADAVEFTSMHTWWLNDALLWDGLAAKAGGKPLLVSETGVMQRELLSGEARRGPDDAARLLSRKIGYAFAARAFGAVQWCYDVNAYMVSDNEVAIGLRRVDGSYKPEHRVLREMAAFVHRNRARFESPRESDVVVIMPSAEAFSPRDEATRSVQRAVRTLVDEVGVAVRLVPDYRAAADLGRPKAIVLPANRGVSDECWRALRAAAEGGATLVCSGWFETDDAGLPVERLGTPRRMLGLVEECGLPAVAGSQGQRYASVRYPRAVAESGFAGAERAAPREIRAKAGRMYYHPLPLEWAEAGGEAALREFYVAGLKLAGVTASEEPLNRGGLFRHEIAYKDGRLLILINEAGADRETSVGGQRGTVRVPAGECVLVWLTADGRRIADDSRRGGP